MKDSYLIYAGWLIDGTGGPIQRKVLIRVEKGLLAAIEKEVGQERLIQAEGDPKLPFVNLGRSTLMPVLVDSHVHLFMSGEQDPELRKTQLSQPFDSIKEVIARHLAQHLAHGVLAVRDGGDYGGHSLRYKRECLDNSPVIVKSPGRAWRAQGRYGRLIGRPPPRQDSLAEAIAACKDPVDHIKIVNSGLNSLLRFGKETPPQFTAEELEAAVTAGNRRGLRTMVHANGRLPVDLAVKAGCHSLEHGFFMGRENLERMAASQTAWVPTVFTMKAYAEELDPGSREAQTARKNLDHQLEQIELARRLGVSIAVGTDCGSLGVHHGKAIREEMGMLMLAGLSLERAVQSASHTGACLLGLEQELGRLLPGLPASFIAVETGPATLPDSLASPQGIFLQGTSL